MVAFDDIEWFDCLDTPLSMIAHDAGALGRRAVELLLRVIDGDDPESVVLPTRFIDRSMSAPSIGEVGSG